jgi:hypothetical protein
MTNEATPSAKNQEQGRHPLTRWIGWTRLARPQSLDHLTERAVVDPSCKERGIDSVG